MILEWILGGYILYLLIKLYASLMEIGFVQKARVLTPVILSPSNYVKAADYKIASQKLSMLSSLFDFVLFFGWMTFGLSALEEWVNVQNETLFTVLFVVCFIAINYVLNLPFDVYQTFVLDKKFGFSTIDTKTYIVDHIKSSIVFAIFGSAFFAVMSFIIVHLEYWWFYGFLFAFGIILFINMIYPIVIVPLFNKLTPLNDEELRESITTLLAKAGLKSSGVFSMDASKRDNRLNAYFGGLGSSKRVVLFDTLIAKLEKKELLSVLGHELGHFKHKDILKNIAASAFMLLTMFWIFGNMPQELFESLHVRNSAHSIMVLFLLLSPLISFVIMPLFGLMSRYNEYQADAYGSECESKEALCLALMKLADENKSFPYAHPLTIILYFTHPPLTKRLEKLGMKFSENMKEALAH